MAERAWLVSAMRWSHLMPREVARDEDRSEEFLFEEEIFEARLGRVQPRVDDLASRPRMVQVHGDRVDQHHAGDAPASRAYVAMCDVCGIG